MRHISYILFGMLLLSACNPNLRPFTQGLYDQYDWSETDLKRVQFYLSEEIILTRELTKGTSEIISGDIKIVDGKRVEQVTIPRGTPGILLFIPKEERFAVSFEDGGEERFLMFGPNPKSGNEYKLLASEWKNARGRVQYDGKYYWTKQGDQLATLLIDMKRINEREVNRRTATGRKVS